MRDAQRESEELLGALDSFKDGAEVELVQIVKGTDWKGARFDLKSPPQAHAYPVERGTYFPLSANEALLRTQGNVQGVHVTNPGNNVYTEGALKPTGALRSMGLARLIGILVLVLVIAALVKYVFFR